MKRIILCLIFPPIFVLFAGCSSLKDYKPLYQVEPEKESLANSAPKDKSDIRWS
jgi:hypothetical protein